MRANALALQPTRQAAPKEEAAWLLHTATADARDRLWAHPALLRLQEPGLALDEYAATMLRLLLAYRHAESSLDAALPGGLDATTALVARSPMIARDLDALGRPVPQMRSWDWSGAKGRPAYLGLRCGLAQIESGADAVARRLWRFHPELWSSAAGFWRYLRIQDLKPPMRDGAVGALPRATDLEVTSRTAIDICRMFGAYLSA